MTDAQFREALIDALHEIAGGKVRGPSGLEGIGMALAGDDFISRKESLASAVYAVAAALDRIAQHLESRP